MLALEPYLQRLTAGGVRLRMDPQLFQGPDATQPVREPRGGCRTLQVPGIGALREHYGPEHAADAATMLLARVLGEGLELTGVERAWDLGCGTGVLAVVLSRLGIPQVRASDTRTEALELASATLSEAGVRADLREGHLLTPFAGEAPEDLLVTNLPHKPCTAGAPEVSGPFAGEHGDELYDALRRALLRRAQPSRLLFFQHSLPHPALLLRWSAHFDLRLLAWSRRFLGATELPHMRKAYRMRHHLGHSYLGREGEQEYLVGSVFEAIGP